VRRLTLVLSIAIAACAGAPTSAPAPVVAKAHAAAVPLIDFEMPWASIAPEQAGLARAPLETLIRECQKTDTDALLIVAVTASSSRARSGTRRRRWIPRA